MEAAVGTGIPRGPAGGYMPEAYRIASRTARFAQKRIADLRNGEGPQKVSPVVLRPTSQGCRSTAALHPGTRVQEVSRMADS